MRLRVALLSAALALAVVGAETASQLPRAAATNHKYADSFVTVEAGVGDR
jgi:hypothetical protein